MPLPFLWAAGAAAIRILPVAATALRAGTTAVGAYLKGSPSRAAIFATAATALAAPVALKVAEHESGGAVSKATIGLLKDAVKEGASPQAIERMINGIDYIVAVNNAFDKAAQNVYVAGRMNRKEGDDAIMAGKRAAVEFQLLPQNMAALTVKHGVRILNADGLFKGDKNAADKYLANSLIDDIVKNAQVSELGDNQVTREDVRKTLNEAIRNPDKHPVASRFFDSQDNQLMNGLKQIWPEMTLELTQEQRPAASAGVSAPSFARQQEKKDHKGSSLRDTFSMAANGEGGILGVIVMLLALMLQSLGLGKGLTSNFMSNAAPGSSPIPKPEQDNDKPVPRMTPVPVMLRPGF